MKRNRVPILVRIRRNGLIPRILPGGRVARIADKDCHDRVRIHGLDRVAIRLHLVEIRGRRGEEPWVKISLVGEFPGRHGNLVGLHIGRQLPNGVGCVGERVGAYNEPSPQQIGPARRVDDSAAAFPCDILNEFRVRTCCVAGKLRQPIRHLLACLPVVDVTRISTREPQPSIADFGGKGVEAVVPVLDWEADLIVHAGESGMKRSS